MRSLMLAGSVLALGFATVVQAAPAPVAAVAEAVPPAPAGKLDDAVKPSLYRLDLTVDPNKPRFSGHVE
ncbi:MAG: hypothetical protein KGN34_14335, partial [Sphingomonadales bacterium]|nr:hypothetical protein [Sphingomonadales bacterium]